MNKRNKTRPLNKKRPSNSRHTASSAPSKQAWVIAIVLIAIFVGGIAYLNYYRNSNPSSAIHRLLNNHKSSHTVKAPDFEFYTALPSGKLTPMTENEGAPSTNTASPPSTNLTPKTITNIPANANTAVTPATVKVVNTPTKTPSAAPGNTDYFLQVAAFAGYDDADKLKAQLLLDEFNANVSSYQSNNKKLYRVVVGPFHDLAALSQAQNQLNKLHYQSIRLQPMK